MVVIIESSLPTTGNYTDDLSPSVTRYGVRRSRLQSARQLSRVHLLKGLHLFNPAAVAWSSVLLQVVATMPNPIAFSTCMPVDMHIVTPQVDLYCADPVAGCI